MKDNELIVNVITKLKDTTTLLPDIGISLWNTSSITPVGLSTLPNIAAPDAKNLNLGKTAVTTGSDYTRVISTMAAGTLKASDINSKIYMDEDCTKEWTESTYITSTSSYNNTKLPNGKYSVNVAIYPNDIELVSEPKVALDCSSTANSPHAVIIQEVTFEFKQRVYDSDYPTDSAPNPTNDDGTPYRPGDTTGGGSTTDIPIPDKDWVIKHDKDKAYRYFDINATDPNGHYTINDPGKTVYSIYIAPVVFTQPDYMSVSKATLYLDDAIEAVNVNDAAGKVQSGKVKLSLNGDGKNIIDNCVVSVLADSSIADATLIANNNELCKLRMNYRIQIDNGYDTPKYETNDVDIPLYIYARQLERLD